METAGKLIKDEKMAALMKKEKRGLGTPATRQVILSTLKKQNLLLFPANKLKLQIKEFILLKTLLLTR